ncbi:protein SCO1/2 [Filimonas lacunae]|uniref:Protein SCO1/2 n=1 Tax=Filimonas lacunae TaxID=477680 RepID=A0A173MQH3_9BACT|nr:SCO family protein [Filimonas lacunae]BAV09588.1 SCO1/SenC family lipoprotein [Filimonas lacunae]SIS75593.1 protein SCO1/2 [Filimonas lacunae]
MNSKKLIIYCAFFVCLAVGFWFFLFRGTENWKSKSVTLSTVKPFSFTTQDNQTFTERDMQGKVCVVEYFFTTCKGICPRMNANMHKIYNTFKDEPDFMIVSHTCDPETDSVPVIKHYSDSLKVNNHRWVFLTGRKDSLYAAARYSYLLDDPKNGLDNIKDQFIHTQFFAVVDKNGQVRGQIYDGLKEDELAKLKTDIATLLKEKQGKSGFNSSIFTNNPQ